MGYEMQIMRGDRLHNGLKMIESHLKLEALDDI
jgi:hypothetical protein